MALGFKGWVAYVCLLQHSLSHVQYGRFRQLPMSVCRLVVWDCVRWLCYLLIVLVVKSCAAQVCRCPVRVFENGFSDLGVPQVGIDQSGTGQVSLVEARGTQVGVCQVGIGQDGLLQPCATQVGIRQDGVGQVCVFEDCVPEVCGGEIQTL